jgi:hypothetical protein
MGGQGSRTESFALSRLPASYKLRKVKAMSGDDGLKVMGYVQIDEPPIGDHLGEMTGERLRRLSTLRDAEADSYG